MAARTKFYIDKQNKKVCGVCAGIADYTGFDVTIIRIAMLVMALSTGGPIFLAYFVAAWMAPDKPYGLYETQEDAKFWQGVRSNPKRSAAEVRSTFRDLDRRLADMETLYTSRNTQLANEIESLR